MINSTLNKGIEMSNLTAYERGVRDCINGLKPSETSNDYMMGYSEQYAQEQQQSQSGFN